MVCRDRKMKYKLKDIFDLQMGKTPSRNNIEFWIARDYKWISIADLTKTTKYISETKEYLSKSAAEESKIKVIPANTVVMSFKLSIGKVAITSEDMYSNEAIMAFHDKHIVEILPEYIFYMFKYKNWEEDSNKAVMGKTLNKASLSEIEINITPIEKQKEIVQVLNKMMDIISARENEIKLLDDLIKARFVEMFGDPVNNPHGWDKTELKELADLKIGPFGSLLHKEDYIKGGHAFVNPSHIVDGRISADPKLTVSNEKYEELSAYHLKVGDVVMGRRGEMGRCAVVEEEGLLCGTGCLLIKPKGKVTADFIQKIISYPTFKKTIEDMAVGQTMPNLNVPIVSGFSIITPPIEVQKNYYYFIAQVDKSKFVPHSN